MDTASWSVSGLSVVARTHHMNEVEDRLNDLPGVAVHGREPESGRLVVVHEAEDVDRHETRLREIQSWSEVLTADLVMFVSEDGKDVPISGGA